MDNNGVLAIGSGTVLLGGGMFAHHHITKKSELTSKFAIKKTDLTTRRAFGQARARTAPAFEKGFTRLASAADLYAAAATLDRTAPNGPLSPSDEAARNGLLDRANRRAADGTRSLNEANVKIKESVADARLTYHTPSETLRVHPRNVGRELIEIAKASTYTVETPSSEFRSRGTSAIASGHAWSADAKVAAGEIKTLRAKHAADIVRPGKLGKTGAVVAMAGAVGCLAATGIGIAREVKDDS